MSEAQNKIGFFKKQLPWMVFGAIMLLIGHEFAHFTVNSNVQKSQMLSQSNQNFVKENEQLNEQLNQFKIELDVAQLNLEKTQEMLLEAMERETELEKQINFYQRVVAPEETTDGFLIEYSELIRSQDENAFTLSLVLLQKQNIKDVIKGSLDIRLFGTSDGKFVNYALSELSEETQAFNYGFRYFQVKDIPFVLPLGFAPERFEISTDIYKFKRKRGTYKKTIRWTEVAVENENT